MHVACQTQTQENVDGFSRESGRIMNIFPGYRDEREISRLDAPAGRRASF
jgi:hypothetical protein